METSPKLRGVKSFVSKTCANERHGESKPTHWRAVLQLQYFIGDTNYDDILLIIIANINRQLIWWWTSLCCDEMKRIIAYLVVLLYTVQRTSYVAVWTATLGCSRASTSELVHSVFIGKYNAQRYRLTPHPIAPCHPECTSSPSHTALTLLWRRQKVDAREQPSVGDP